MSTTALLEKQAATNQNTDEMPLVSICIPTYNGAEFIRQTMQSLIDQNYNNIEIIVVDDCSTDKTIEYVKEFDDPRIKVIVNDSNLGPLGNYSKSLSYSSGKYAKMICQDDILLPEMIEKQVAVMEENSNVSVVTGASRVIDEKDNVIMTRRLYKHDKIIDGKKFILRTFSGRNLYGEPFLNLYRTEDMKKGEGLYTDNEVYFCADWDASLLMSYYGDVYYISDFIGLYRINNASLTADVYKKEKKRIYESSMALFKKHQKYGKIKLTWFHYARFSLMIHLYSVARWIIRKIK